MFDYVEADLNDRVAVGRAVVGNENDSRKSLLRCWMGTSDSE